MITQKFLESCTDEQINKGVAWLEAKRLGVENPCEFMSYGDGLVFNDGKYSFAPCIEPNDAWPIILENKIGLDPLRSGKWVALNSDWSIAGIESCSKNPLRAAMIVYILMSVSQND